MPRRHPVVVLLVSMLVLICGTACGGGTGRLASGKDYSVRDALAEIPQTALRKPNGHLQVFTGDLAAATGYGTAPRPDSAEQTQAVRSWLGPLSGGTSSEEAAPVYLPLPQLLSPNQPVQQVASELGWSVVDVDAYTAVSAPPDQFTVVTGTVGKDHLDSKLAKVDDGIVSAGTGGDFHQDLAHVTAARPLGMPLRMAAQGHRIAASPSTPAVRAWLDGPKKTLADAPSLAAVAEALDEADVVSAVVVRGGGSYDAVGIGWAVKDGAALITVAFHYPDAETAAAQVAPIRDAFTGPGQGGKPLEQVVHVEQVTSDNAVVVAALTVPDGSRPGAVFQMLVAQDGPFGG